MKIGEILRRNRPTVSFEVFPPKKDLPLEATQRVVAEIAALKPGFISVTCGAAGGSTGANTARLAGFIERECGVTALAHLTCVASSRERVAADVAVLRERGVENILCLRGDLPPGATAPAPGAFAHASELVAALRPAGFCLGGACYPEGHPECAHLADDIAHLKAKVEAGLDFLTTQMFFDNNIYFHYLARLRDVGITLPVVPGIMPVTNGRQIARICALSGTYLPPRFRAIVDRFGGDSASMLDAGVAYATEQLIDLFAHGVSYAHVYTMNKPEVARRILRNLAGIVRGE